MHIVLRTCFEGQTFLAAALITHWNGKARIPNLGYMYPKGYICLSKGIHLRLALEEKNIIT